MNTQLKSILAKKLAAKKGNKLQQGFTLIELMVVVAIVGVLTAVGLPQLTAAQDKAKDAAAKAEVVNAGKTCSIDVLTGAEGYDTTECRTVLHWLIYQGYQDRVSWYGSIHCCSHCSGVKA